MSISPTGPIALSGKEAIWANSTSLRVNLLGWATRCPVEQWQVVLRRAGTPAWTPLQVGTHSAQAEGLSPGTWYEVRVTAESGAGETVALYRVATFTLQGGAHFI